MKPDCASRRATISCRMVSKASTEISRSCSLRISTKRDMCVPLKLCGRCTYMLKVATVCCTPMLLSFTFTGWRMPLMPTRLMARWRISAELCTSAMGLDLGMVMAGLLSSCGSAELWSIRNSLTGQSFFDARGQPAGVQPAVRQHLPMLALFDETVGQAELQQRRNNAVLLQAFRDRAARAALHGVFFHGHHQLVFAREAQHQLGIQRLDEAHVGNAGVELLAGLERRCQHRAERQNRDLAAFAPQLALAHRQSEE